MRLIDGEELAKMFREMANTEDSKNNRTWWSEALISADEDVDDAPTVDAVERKRGRWVDNGIDSIGFMGIEYRLQKCSNCGETIAKAPMQRLPNFCSNCGADMRVESNG